MLASLEPAAVHATLATASLALTTATATAGWFGWRLAHIRRQLAAARHAACHETGSPDC